jgi:hypothetical protein
VQQRLPLIFIIQARRGKKRLFDMQNIHIWKKVSKVQILSPSDIELSYFVTFWSSGGCRNGEMKKKKEKKEKGL